MARKINAAIHNKFEFEVIDIRTGKLKQSAIAYNVLCTGFWSRCTNRLSSDSTWNTGISYGDGTGTPAESDTALFSNRGYKAYTGIASIITDDRINGVIAARSKAVINPEEAVGVDISEIGMSDSGNALLSHAMLQDMNGNTIVIHKTDTDLINIYATVYLHWNPNEMYLANDSNSYAYGVQSILYKLFGMSFGGTMYGLSSITPTLLKTARGAYTLTDTYSFPQVNMPSGTITTSNKRLHYNKSRLAADAGNSSGGYRFINIRNFAIIDISKVTDPAVITEEAVGTGDGTKTRFGTIFDFPYNATVYVNGVAQSNVVVKKNPGKSYRMLGDYFDQILGNSTLQKQIPALYWFSLDWHPVRSYSDRIECTENFYFRNVANDIGITHMKNNSSTSLIRVSNDLINWVDITPENVNKTSVPEEYRHYKFFNLYQAEVYFEYDGCNIEFETAPAEGDVITIDYTTDVLAKDANHVYDLEWELSFDNRNVE